MKNCTINLIDEVNCIIKGLTEEHYEHFYESYGFLAKGYFFNPKYTLGIWDGKIRFFKKTGNTYIHLLNEIIPFLIELEYKINVIDNREKTKIIPPLIDKNYFSNYKDKDNNEPYVLRYYQVDSVNSVLKDNGGIIIAGTGAGKTLINAAIIDSYGKFGLKTITVVPNQDLIFQTINQFKILELDVGEFSGSKKDLNHLHIVSTWQTLQNTPEVLKMFNVIVIDEAHGAKATILYKLLTEYAEHIIYRFGLTGTLPKDKVDELNVKITLGEVKYTIKASDLIEQNILSSLNIDIIQFDENVEEEWKKYKIECDIINKTPKTYKQFKDDYSCNFSDEKLLLENNKIRSEFISKYIIELQNKEKGNVFCLVNNIKFGKKLTKLVPNSKFVYGKDSQKIRQTVYDLFKTNNNITVFATVSIASLGLNIPRIFNLVYIDIGKSFIRIIQTIGRGLRKAKDKHHICVTDITSDYKYCNKHLRERIKYYNEAKYPYKKYIVKYKNDVE